ncbi:addiction module protein [Leucobacter sp. OLJS4]|uniref:addiction module protein n=1 Tax=unclassified Leucobacter TaxID=2621730 RepID=UPI000C1748AF|nr:MULTISPECIES: addiction module protein [unclassified Leucobacter]PIJ47405.1 addiction module protein [Leucobacter sp. OLES1]PII87800.1 addiction module protein [Leucobacter sp. OLTLW20]PII93888.1 addiction module protein [Leucobacter sp. OLAS13]PII98443.1 addiction module protein [Leucobacter sp. OLDS2]PIJ00424.1 addiction module protein [Leucobacter sp. OLCS4]
MAPDTATLIRDGLALDIDQRALLVNALLESLHEAAGSSGSQAAWRAAASRRLAGVRSGQVELTNADEHYASLRDSLTA